MQMKRTESQGSNARARQGHPCYHEAVQADSRGCVTPPSHLSVWATQWLHSSLGTSSESLGTEAPLSLFSCPPCIHPLLLRSCDRSGHYHCWAEFLPTPCSCFQLVPRPPASFPQPLPPGNWFIEAAHE